MNRLLPLVLALAMVAVAAAVTDIGPGEPETYFDEEGLVVELGVALNPSVKVLNGEILERGNGWTSVRPDVLGEDLVLSSGNSTRNVSYTVPEPELERSSRSEGLITERTTVTYRNTAPVSSDRTLTVTVPRYLVPFVELEKPPDSSAVDGFNRVYRWHREVAPGGSFSVSYTVDRGMPAAVLLGLLVGVYGLKRMKGRVTVEKEIFEKEGELEVRITVFSSRREEIRDLEVSDFLPETLEPEGFKTGRPKVKETEHGTRLGWEVDRLGPDESRVLIYSVKPSSEVGTDHELPAAELLDSDGTRIARSERSSASISGDSKG